MSINVVDTTSYFQLAKSQLADERFYSKRKRNDQHQTVHLAVEMTTANKNIYCFCALLKIRKVI